MKAREICPAESREKTEQQVKEAEEVEVGWGSKEPLRHAESVGEQDWEGLKHLQVSRKEADACKGTEWGAVGEQEKHCLKRPARITPQAEIFPLRIEMTITLVELEGYGTVNRRGLLKEQTALLRGYLEKHKNINLGGNF